MSRFTVNNIFTVAFCSRWSHDSRSRVAVNGITVMGDPYRLHTPVQEVMKMQTGMKKVVLNHRGLLVVSDDGPAELCVEISPSELLELLTTFSTAPSLCG